MRYLYYILRLFFCPHKYEKEGISRVYADGDINKKEGSLPIHNRIICRCTRCGKFKNFDV